MGLLLKIIKELYIIVKRVIFLFSQKLKDFSLEKEYYSQDLYKMEWLSLNRVIKFLNFIFRILRRFVCEFYLLFKVIKNFINKIYIAILKVIIYLLKHSIRLNLKGERTTTVEKYEAIKLYVQEIVEDVYKRYLGTKDLMFQILILVVLFIPEIIEYFLMKFKVACYHPYVSICVLFYDYIGNLVLQDILRYLLIIIYHTILYFIFIRLSIKQVVYVSSPIVFLAWWYLYSILRLVDEDNRVIKEGLEPVQIDVVLSLEDIIEIVSFRKI